MSKVIVIEEDVAMRELIAEWLEEEGYEVRALASVYTSRAGDDLSAELVVVDLVNLRSQAAQAIDAVRARFPAATVIGVSTQAGRSLGTNSGIIGDLGLVSLLAKPCERGELVDAVAEAIVARN